MVCVNNEPKLRANCGVNNTRNVVCALKNTLKMFELF